MRRRSGTPGRHRRCHVGFPCRLPDDLRTEPAQQAEQRALLGGGDAELVERAHEVLDERVELGVGDPHSRVRGAHVPARVAARAAGGRADLLHEQRTLLSSARFYGRGWPGGFAFARSL